MSQRVGPHRISQAVEDRNRGQGLPSVVGDDGYHRIAEALNRRSARTHASVNANRAPQRRTAALAPAPAPQLELRRFASLEAVQGAGFKRVAQGLYREANLGKSAHPIWELRGAEDSEGFVLVRKKEERAVDLRQAAGAGTAAAVEAGIMQRTARSQSNLRRRAAEKFMVSLLQTPSGDIKQRKTVMPEQAMDVEDLQRLVDELQLGPTSHNFDTWSDGEWELRIRGPGGQLIHDYESVGPDEIGGERGRGLLDVINGVLPVEEDGDLGEPMEGEMPMPEGEGDEGGLLGGEEEVTEPGAEAVPPPPPEGALPPPPPPGGEPGAPPPVVPPEGALAPSAARLKRGRRIAVIKNGQVADAIVVMVRPQQQALDVVMEKAMGGAGGAGGGAGGMGGALGGGPFGDAGMMGGTVETIPMLDVVDMGEDGDEAEIEIEGDEADPFEVDIEPASEEPAYEDGQGGEVVETPAPFGPGESSGPDTYDDAAEDVGGNDDGGAPFGSDNEAFDDAFLG